jgi:hypothetical protein
MGRSGLRAQRQGQAQLRALRARSWRRVVGVIQCGSKLCIARLADVARVCVSRVVSNPQGATLPDSRVVKGMVLKRDTEGTVKSVEDVKVAAYTQVRILMVLRIFHELGYVCYYPK